MAPAFRVVGVCGQDARYVGVRKNYLDTFQKPNSSKLPSHTGGFIVMSLGTGRDGAVHRH